MAWSSSPARPGHTMHIINRSEGPKPGYCSACQRMALRTYEVESAGFRLCLPHIAYAYRLATTKK